MEPRKEEKHEPKAAEPRKAEPKLRLRIVKLEPRIAPSNANFPPGAFPSGNPAHAPGQSNPNENAGPR